MNRFTTYSANAKILKLLESTQSRAVRIIQAGSKLGLELVHTPQTFADIVLTYTPRVYTDLATLQLLDDGSIDYDYSQEEFVLTAEAVSA